MLSPMDEFREYLRAEYRHIAEAHFRTIEAISSFFRYYLLIMSAPITILAVFIGLSDNWQGIASTIESLRWVLFATLVVISAVGFCVMLYIINLRMDVILYARTVNAIRKSFYDQAPMDIDVKLRTRVLPQTPVQPSYEEPPYFIPVVLAFAFFNTFYLTLALIVAFWSFDEIAHMGDWFGRVSLWSLFGLIFFPVHLISYKWYAHHREHAYLRSFTSGVDIDGVLNKHRDHFSKLLKENVGTERDPDSFTTIPLHECPAIGVSREDEKQVFNDPRYWTEMPLMDDAAQNLERLQNLNLKVHIFSHRPWPNTSGMSQNNRKAIHQQWNTQALSFTRRVYGKKSLRSLFDRVRLWIGTSELEASRIPWFRLDKGTLSWLRRAQARLGTAPIDQFTKCEPLQDWGNQAKVNSALKTISGVLSDVETPIYRSPNLGQT